MRCSVKSGVCRKKKGKFVLTTINFCIGATIVVYLIGMLFIGFLYSKQNESTSDFYLGGRKLGPFVTAMSAEASDMSSYLLMGLPGLAYLTGLCDVTWTVIGLAFGTWLNWLMVARRLRRYSSNIGAITVPDFFSKRFHDEKNLLNCLAALVIVVFFVPYTASGFAACGKLFNSLFGVNYHVAMTLSAVVILVYTVLGGFMAVSTTDLVQSIVMTFALLVVMIYGVNAAGGMEAVMQNASSMTGYLSMTATHSMADGAAKPYGFITVISTLAWGLGYFGMPHILLRFMAIEDEDKLKLSRRIASVWVVISMAVAVLIGIVGNAMTKVGLVPLLASSGESETIIVQITHLISQNGVLFSIVAGLILAGILAATMSTADSQLLAASSSVSQNLVQDFLHIKLSTKQSLLVARATILGISVVAILLAQDPNSSVFQIVSFAWAGFGGAFGPLMLCCLFWKRTTLPGALTGLVSGGVMVFVWKFLVRPLGGVWNIYELLPAFMVSLVLIVVVSLCTKAPEQSILDEFEAAKG